MPSHKRSRACLGDWTLQGGAHSLCLAGFRNVAYPGLRAEESGTRDCHGPVGNRSGIFEVAFSGLLAATGFVERHDFHRCRIMEVRNRRVVECNMTILP